MSQFQLYRNKDKHSSGTYPFFIDVQNALFGGFNTRVVIPLTPLARLSHQVPKKLCPIIHLPEGEFAILTQQITSVPIKILSEPIGNLTTFRDEVIAALDFLITGV